MKSAGFCYDDGIVEPSLSALLRASPHLTLLLMADGRVCAPPPTLTLLLLLSSLHFGFSSFDLSSLLAKS
ncbi:MAG TPA: hypothetical protein V6D20_24840, partial [Candidatus Obscuribacterales bacterium]